MKRIIVFCDGTGNDQINAKNPTNIRIMYENLKLSDSDKVVYFPGVGVDFTETLNKKILDSALAMSFNYIIKEVYSFISTNYAPGDEIYLFGFSRGSAAVRSLSNFIRTYGLNRDGHIIKQSFKDYQNGCKSLGSAAALEDNEVKFSFATEKDGSNPLHNNVKQPTIKFIGIFDTVHGLKDEEFRQHDFSYHRGFHERFCHLMASNITSNYHNLPFGPLEINSDAQTLPLPLLGRAGGQSKVVCQLLYIYTLNLSNNNGTLLQLLF
jgi:hypothetical protein